jgi:hypothetical protein
MVRKADLLLQRKALFGFQRACEQREYPVRERGQSADQRGRGTGMREPKEIFALRL